MDRTWAREKSSNLKKRNNEKTNVRQIKTGDGDILSDPNIILEEIGSFFKPFAPLIAPKKILRLLLFSCLDVPKRGSKWPNNKI